MKGMIALLTATMVIYFIFTLLQYFHWSNTSPQQLWPVKYNRNSLIWTVFPPIPLCNRQNLQYFHQLCSVTYFLVRLNCTYKFIVVYSTILSYVFFILSCTTLQFRFVWSHSIIVSYVLSIPSFTTCWFWFVCSLFVLFFWSETNTPHPCRTNKVGGSHRFPLPFKSHCWRSCYSRRPSTINTPALPCTHWFQPTNKAIQDCPSK